MTLTLVLNAGSSSLKYQVFEGETSILRGNIEKSQWDGDDHFFHADAFAEVVKQLHEAKVQSEDIEYVGYRVVHGGEKFSESILINDESMNDIANLSQLAPLHIPPVIEVIKASWNTFVNAELIAVFDTAFHSTLGEVAYTYPITHTISEKYGIRKYGFHGMSHQYVAEMAALQLGKHLKNLNAITCHLGAGSSITAIQSGRSVDTSMGFTPLAGLMMATRSGDIDPGIILHLLRAGFDGDELHDMLNAESGLKGIAGSEDMREIREQSSTDSRARLAREMYIRKVVHYIGAYLALVPDIEVIVFTGGIGENDENLREQVIERLQHLGVGTKIKVLVIPTNEELAIARECWKVAKK
jgi:acetate kinase